jgi:hypothetical protein
MITPFAAAAQRGVSRRRAQLRTAALRRACTAHAATAARLRWRTTRGKGREGGVRVFAFRRSLCPSALARWGCVAVWPPATTAGQKRSTTPLQRGASACLLAAAESGRVGDATPSAASSARAGATIINQQAALLKKSARGRACSAVAAAHAARWRPRMRRGRAAAVGASAARRAASAYLGYIAHGVSAPWEVLVMRAGSR